MGPLLHGFTLFVLGVLILYATLWLGAVLGADHRRRRAERQRYRRLLAAIGTADIDPATLAAARAHATAASSPKSHIAAPAPVPAHAATSPTGAHDGVPAHAAASAVRIVPAPLPGRPPTPPASARLARPAPPMRPVRRAFEPAVTGELVQLRTLEVQAA